MADSVNAEAADKVAALLVLFRVAAPPLAVNVNEPDWISMVVGPVKAVTETPVVPSINIEPVEVVIAILPEADDNVTP